MLLGLFINKTKRFFKYFIKNITKLKNNQLKHTFRQLILLPNTISEIYCLVKRISTDISTIKSSFLQFEFNHNEKNFLNAYDSLSKKSIQSKKENISFDLLDSLPLENGSSRKKYSLMDFDANSFNYFSRLELYDKICELLSSNPLFTYEEASNKILDDYYNR